jgi:uncharacterized protein (DUF433 family)
VAEDNIVVRDPAIMSGAPVVRGTRVPVVAIFENLADGMSIDEIVRQFPSLTRELVERVLHEASRRFERPAA